MEHVVANDLAVHTLDPDFLGPNSTHDLYAFELVHAAVMYSSHSPSYIRTMYVPMVLVDYLRHLSNTLDSRVHNLLCRVHVLLRNDHF